MKNFIAALKSATIQTGYDGGTYLVFPTTIEAEAVRWLLWSILRRPVCCFGNYENAYQIY